MCPGWWDQPRPGLQLTLYPGWWRGHRCGLLGRSQPHPLKARSTSTLFVTTQDVSRCCEMSPGDRCHRPRVAVLRSGGTGEPGSRPTVNGGQRTVDMGRATSRRGARSRPRLQQMDLNPESRACESRHRPRHPRYLWKDPPRPRAGTPHAVTSAPLSVGVCHVSHDRFLLGVT